MLSRKKGNQDQQELNNRYKDELKQVRLRQQLESYYICKLLQCTLIKLSKKEKVDSSSTCMISYTDPIDCQCIEFHNYCSVVMLVYGSVSYIKWERYSSSIRNIRSYDLEIHWWLNTFIKQWQILKQIAKSHQNTANQWEIVINEETCLLIKGIYRVVSLSVTPHSLIVQNRLLMSDIEKSRVRFTQDLKPRIAPYF